MFLQFLCNMFGISSFKYNENQLEKINHQKFRSPQRVLAQWCKTPALNTGCVLSRPYKQSRTKILIPGI